MKWKDCHYKHNYGNTRPAGRKRKGYENAAPELQISLSFFPRSFRGGTPRNQTWGRGWFPGRTSGEKLFLPVLGLPRDFDAAAKCKKSPPWSTQKGSGIFLSSDHCLLQLITLPKLAESLETLWQTKPQIASLQLVSCIPPLSTMNLEASSQQATYSFLIKQLPFIIFPRTLFLSQGPKIGIIPLLNPTEKRKIEIITIHTCLSTSNNSLWIIHPAVATAQ